MLFMSLLVFSPAPGVDMWHLSYTPLPCQFSLLSLWWECHVNCLYLRMLFWPHGLAVLSQRQSDTVTLSSTAPCCSDTQLCQRHAQVP